MRLFNNIRAALWNYQLLIVVDSKQLLKGDLSFEDVDAWE
jgi:hypothetical protein